MLFSKLKFAALACAACATIASAEMKMGFINSEEIFKSYQGTKEAQDKFNKEVAKWEQQATDMQKEIKDLKEKLDKQGLLLSIERKKEIEEKLKTKLATYQEFLQTKFGQQGEAVSKNEELTKPIIAKINKIINKIAKDENYDFIFDQRGGALVFAKDSYDLTTRVVTILNKEKD